ncbi:A24 family peptidase [uncultured Clostridium sp.]|uniref:prepilin peptidase n=1 Tax=uncultured Clostridium sp. TaxID=59620 RepID=UPI00260665E0|nr:A24 family peptidase [uncultured Clostridium sp.]
MILIILIIAAMLGVVLNFISYFIAVEDFVGEEAAQGMKLPEIVMFAVNRIKNEKNFLILISTITIIVYISLYLKFGFIYEFYKYGFLFAILIISSIIDVKTRSVYLIISIVGIIGGVVFSTINIFDGADVVTEMLSVLIPILILGFLKIVSRKFDGLGGGDIEVFIFIALYMSIVGTGLDLFIALIIGGIISGISLAKGNKSRYIPFVPYISLATFITVMFGNDIILGYINVV